MVTALLNAARAISRLASSCYCSIVLSAPSNGHGTDTSRRGVPGDLRLGARIVRGALSCWSLGGPPESDGTGPVVDVDFGWVAQERTRI